MIPPFFSTGDHWLLLSDRSTATHVGVEVVQEEEVARVAPRPRPPVRDQLPPGDLGVDGVDLEPQELSGLGGGEEHGHGSARHGRQASQPVRDQVG